MRRLGLSVLSIALLLGVATAQQGEDLRVLVGPEFPEPRKLLERWLNKRGLELLEKRDRAIAAISDRDAAARRHAYVRERILASIGGLPERTPLQTKVVGTLEREGYRVEKVIFESQPAFYVTANLYVPTRGAGPFPAVLFPLGHELGAKAHEAWQRFLITVARNGFVALAWDPIGQGERVQHFDPDLGDSRMIRSTTEHSVLGIQCLLTGANLARYTIWDGMRALDYLESRPEVDRRHIACTGNSGGGTHTAYLSTLDDRIQVAAPSCYITSYRRLLETIGPQDAEQVMLPFLADGLDQADFVETFAPKPYLILSAIRDFFSIAGARESFQEARRFYRLSGAENNLQMVEADDGHGYTLPRRLAAYRWLNRWLKGADGPVEEPRVELESEEALQCTPTGQVATSLRGETVFTLNQKYFEKVRPARKFLAGAEAARAFQREIREVVAARTAFEPGVGSVEVRNFGELLRPTYRIEKLAFESEPGITVPCLLFVPNGSGKRPAILYVHGRGKQTDAAPEADIPALVERGHVVLAVDPRGVGETSDPNPRYDYSFLGQYESAMTALLAGRTLVGMRMRDLARALDVLAARPNVEADGITGYGKGAGGVVLLHLAAVDPRLKRVVLEDMLVSYEAVVRRPIHRQALESVVLGALRSYDFPDLAAALAPRPLRIINPVDPTAHAVPVAEAERAYEPALRVYRLLGAPEGLRVLARKPGAKPPI